MSDDVRDIPNNRIITDPQYQPRSGGLVEAHVRVLMESDPEDWPPLLVTPNPDGTFLLLDGSHRAEAARRMQRTTLRCRIDPDAEYPDGVTANVTHGLPLSINDRKEAVHWWIEAAPGMSDREIAKRVGLSPTTVGKVRKADPTSTVDTRRRAIDPLDKWLLKTVQLDRLPSARDVEREIAAYEKANRPGVAKVYTAVGTALIEASQPYTKGD